MKDEATAAALRVLVIVTPNFNLGATVGFLDPFRASNYLDGSILFRWDLASATGGEVIASNGLGVRTKALREVTSNPQDIVIVSSSWAPETYNSAPLHGALLRWARAGVTLGALDTGAFILAEAGLLRGKRATTHYEHIDSLKELYADTEITEDLFVFDGKLITCCGGSAAMDFALHIIRSMHGDSLANAAARPMANLAFEISRKLAERSRRVVEIYIDEPAELLYLDRLKRDRLRIEVLKVLGVRRPQQLPVQPVSPGVVWAHDLRRVAVAAEQLVRAMFADVVKRTQHAVAIPDDGDRLVGDLSRDERARLPELLRVAHPLPRP